MAGLWDDALKKLIDDSPQDFVSWVAPGSTYERSLPQKLKAVHLYADALLQVTEAGQPALKHIEFQSTYDERIGERLLEYNTLASRENGYLPVSS